MFVQTRWGVRRRKFRRKVQMKAGIDPLLAGDFSGSFRVLHKYHRAHRRNSSSSDALQRAVGVLSIPSPIVGVQDKKSRGRIIGVTLSRITSIACADWSRGHSEFLRSRSYYLPFA